MAGDSDQRHTREWWQLHKDTFTAWASISSVIALDKYFSRPVNAARQRGQQPRGGAANMRSLGSGGLRAVLVHEVEALLEVVEHEAQADAEDNLGLPPELVARL